MESDWKWPGTAPDIVTQQVRIALDECRCPPWESASFGYPGTAPLQCAVQAMNAAIAVNSNNIGDHSLAFRTDGHEQTEHGFDGTQRMEQEAISRLVRLAGGEPTQIGGYLTEGGTAANTAGMWMGRNFLRSLDGDERILIITTRLAHYSILKAADLLGFSSSDIIYAPCNKQGEMDIEALPELLDELQNNGCTKFLFVCTTGSTMLGSVDDIKTINRMRSDRKILSEGTASYLHVDAAFGGFVLPFLADPVKFGFDCGADSVTLDPHKMGGTPFGCGAILYRKEFAQFVTVKAPYLNSEEDWTINGSRSGANAAALWAVLQAKGYEQLAARVQRCIQLRDYAAEQIATKVAFLRPHLGQTNQLCLEIIDHSVIDRLKKVVEGHPHYMHVAPFPKRFDDPNCQAGRALKMILMPHHTHGMVDRFVEKIRQ